MFDALILLCYNVFRRNTLTLSSVATLGVNRRHGGPTQESLWRCRPRRINDLV